MKKRTPKASTGALPAHVRKANIEQILKLMYRERQFAKIDLTRISGISTTTMAKLFNQLEEAGLIEKDEIDRSSFGRPRTFFRLSTEKIALVAAVVDIEEITVAAFNLNGEQVEGSVTVIPTGSELKNFYNRLAKCVNKTIQGDGRKCLQLAVSMPGLIDNSTDDVVLCPNMHWLEKSKPVMQLEKRLPDVPVMVMHEEKALCIAQQLPEEHKNYVLMDFSSGVGAGIFCNGALLTGHSGFAGEIGHITVDPEGEICGCGNRGCLESVASDLVYRRLRKKMSTAQAAEQVMRYQAIGVAAAINLFNPSMIFVHSAMHDELPDYINQLSELSRRRALRSPAEACQIKLAHTGKLKGVALCGIDRIFKSKFE
ncbi:MAG: ROK family transcriptional regulator [Kiritimatiellae bacterium]|nr:ROK family transcriptional regulator [Kiritimatiellia bacterium]